MPREVFAEEIERFLGTLDGVASARVFTTRAGEVSQVYVTAENAADSRAIRRGVGAALISAYGLPVEPWRIQVTQLRDGLRPAEIPHFTVVRVEETVTAGDMAAAVQIAWIRGGEKRAATGRARGTPGPATRLRTLAAATLEAVRDALEPAHRGVSLRQVAGVTFLDRPAVLVAISVGSPGGQETSLGVAQQEGTSEPAVLAVLDAMTKWLVRAAYAADAAQAGGRRWQLEAMRHFVRSSERPEVLPLRAAPRPEREGATEDSFLPQQATDEAPSDAAPAHPAEDGLDPDVVRDLSEIRPERKGGDGMSVNHEPTRAGPAPARTPHASMEEVFYQGLVSGQTPIQVRCRDGYEVPRAVLKDVGTYTLLLETSGGPELVYKHAVISIRPLTAPAAQA